MMEENKNNSNIDSLWLKNLFEDLKDLSSHIYQAKTGFKDMEELFTIDSNQLVEIQLRNLKLTIVKFLNILDNVQTRIDKKFYNRTKKNFDLCYKAFEKPEIYFKLNFNNLRKTKTFFLSEAFFKTLYYVDFCKSKLIKELDPILYFDREESPLDKTRQIKKRR